MSFKDVVELCLAVLLLSLTSTVVGREILSKNDTGMKIFQSGYAADADIDCVDIYKQPAFSHPLLKNHKIQMRPSFLEDLEENEVNSFEMIHTSFKGQGCPPGKVPIQRNKANTSFHQFSNDYPGQHFAIIEFGDVGVLHGARALFSAYTPQVAAPQISAAYIWVQNGLKSSNLNSIQVGWAVHPSLYGDGVSRLTAYWTTDNYQKTRCYNYQCPGFVQLHAHYHLGQTIGETSTYGGTQYGVDLMIKQDQSTGNWWLLIDGNVQVGYWPKELLPVLMDGASFVQYGGWVLASPNGNSPPMGSGQLPNSDYTKSSFFRNIKYVDSSYQENKIFSREVGSLVDSKCYGVNDFGDQGGSNGYTFSFGGPGGQCGT